MRNVIFLKKNIENFEFILKSFFVRNDLYSWNYHFAYKILTKFLKINFKELKKILSKRNNIEQICEYLQILQEELKKKDVNELEKYKIFLREVHYSNILEYLNIKKGKIPKFEIINKNFFVCAETHISEYFITKRRILYNEYLCNKKNNPQINFQNPSKIEEAFFLQTRIYNKNFIKNRDKIQKNLNEFNMLVDWFLDKMFLVKFYNDSFYQKFVKKLKKNIEKLKNILKKQEITKEFYTNINFFNFKLVKQKTVEAENELLIIKEIHYSNILDYLEKKNLKFEKIDDEFFVILEDCVFEYFRRKFKEINNEP